MKIAVLGWGSLIWNPGTLAIVDGFQSGGPQLAVEFSRVSKDGRLTLVIDETAGTACQTYYALSSLETLEAAAGNLQSREKTNTNGVGFIDLRTEKRAAATASRHGKSGEVIRNWAGEKGFDAVIWTALVSNFHEAGKGGEPFTVDAALRYLRKLDKVRFDLAIEYIRNAPLEVQSPVRAATSKSWPT